MEDPKTQAFEQYRLTAINVLAAWGLGSIAGEVLNHSAGYSVLRYLGQGIGTLAILFFFVMFRNEYLAWKRDPSWKRLLRSMLGGLVAMIIVGLFLMMIGWFGEMNRD